MANPFNFEKTDAKFVKSELIKEFHDREMRIAKLTIARQWSLVGLVVTSFFMLLSLALDPQHFFADWSRLVIFTGLVASFALTDQQIKYLKALQDSMVVKRIDP